MNIVEIATEAKLTTEEDERCQSLIGDGKRASDLDKHLAYMICYDACDRKMVDLTVELTIGGRGVVLVARDNVHQNRLLDMLIERGVQSNTIIINDHNHSFTDATVSTGGSDYKVVIIHTGQIRGYRLTRLSVMVMGVYPISHSDREQIRGRICDFTQKATEIVYFTVYTDILNEMMNKQKESMRLGYVAP